MASPGGIEVERVGVWVDVDALGVSVDEARDQRCEAGVLCGIGKVRNNLQQHRTSHKNMIKLRILLLGDLVIYRYSNSARTWLAESRSQRASMSPVMINESVVPSLAVPKLYTVVSSVFGRQLLKSLASS